MTQNETGNRSLSLEPLLSYPRFSLKIVGKKDPSKI